MCLAVSLEQGYLIVTVYSDVQMARTFCNLSRKPSTTPRFKIVLSFLTILLFQISAPTYTKLTLYMVRSRNRYRYSNAQQVLEQRPWRTLLTGLLPTACPAYFLNHAGPVPRDSCLPRGLGPTIPWALLYHSLLNFN